ncbi:MAG: DUF4827 domain-containing protein [Parabacteroides sp.]|nr:DUF4827 domain-containing protein [Parabacteroides sp.]
MKKGFNILLILCAALVAISCSKTKSYTDMLKDEKKAIQRFVDDQGFDILDDFPADSVFKENQFVKLENGVYLNIIEKGSSERAVQYKTKMLYRCKLHYIMDKDTLVYENYGPHSNGTSPIPFTYGDYSASNPYDPSYQWVSEGLQTPLQYVGDRAKVKLIVPFKRGSYSNQSSGQPVYYEILEYIFEDNL